MIGEIAYELIGLYLVVTLVATSLAKLKNWRMSALGVLWEKVISARLAAATIIVVSVVELSLAAGLTLERTPFLAGYATAALFLSFGCYRLAVAAKTSFITCTCAGNIRMNQATFPAMIGMVFASVVQAGLAWAWAFLGNAEHESSLHVIAVAAWVAPLVALVRGWRRTRRERRRNFVSLQAGGT